MSVIVDAFRKSKNSKQSIRDSSVIPHTYKYKSLLINLLATAACIWDAVILIRQTDRLFEGQQCLHLQSQTLSLDCLTLKKEAL